jgi:phosphopantothenoylcysteine decarboxylase
MERRRVLVGATGSVATIKTHLIVKQLQEQGAEVRLSQVIVIPTEVAWRSFALKAEFSCPVVRDHDEWSAWRGRGDPVVHIELRKWAELLVIAPLDANTLAKISSGLCDNLLVRPRQTCVVRAWDFNKPWLVAPAMNTLMWEQPDTSQQLNRLKANAGAEVVDVVSKTLACKDTGRGAMAEPETIVRAVGRALRRVQRTESEVDLGALLGHLAQGSSKSVDGSGETTLTN